MRPKPRSRGAQRCAHLSSRSMRGSSTTVPPSATTCGSLTPRLRRMTSTRSGCEVVLGRELRATILTTAEESDGRFDLSDCTLLPGARTPLHLHRRYEERFWV